MKNRKSTSTRLWQLFSAIAIVFILNFIATRFFFRIDLTNEKRFTLNEETIQLLKSLDDRIYVKVYLEGDLNSSFSRLRNETQELLDEFRVYAKNGLDYEFININDQKSEQDIKDLQRQLYQKGLNPTEVRTKSGNSYKKELIFPGALVYFKTKEQIWQLYEQQERMPVQVGINNSVQNLEYGLVNSIRKLQQPLRPRIAFIRGHRELDTNQTKDIYLALNEYYDVEYIRIKHRIKALRPYSAIVIAWPDTVVDEKDRFILDQYVMRGGKILWCLEPVYTNTDSLKIKGYTLGLNNNIGLEQLLFNYGVRINSGIVQDMQCGAIPINRGYKGGKPDFQLFPWIYKPLVLPKSSHPIVKNLDMIRFDFAGYMDTIKKAGVKKTILLQSSPNSRIQSVPARISLATVSGQMNEKQFKDGNKTLAVLLEGTFDSEYRDRLLSDSIAQDSIIGFRKKSDPTAMIVISDGDVIKNDYNRSTHSISPLGFDKYTGEIFANKMFLVNCVNYLIDGPKLMSLRSREIKLRMLDKKSIGENPMKWKMYNLIFPIFLVCVSGIILVFFRKRKFTSKQ